MGRTKSHRQSLTCCSIKVSLQSGDFSCFYEHYKFQKNILPEHNPGIPEPFLYAARQSVFWSLQAVIPHLNAKTLTDHMHVNACGRVPIKLYLQNPRWGPGAGERHLWFRAELQNFPSKEVGCPTSQINTGELTQGAPTLPQTRSPSVSPQTLHVCTHRDAPVSSLSPVC